MSIAADGHWLFIKLRRSGMFVRRFMNSLDRHSPDHVLFLVSVLKFQISNLQFFYR
jgi:hypothetical protein